MAASRISFLENKRSQINSHADIFSYEHLKMMSEQLQVFMKKCEDLESEII
jgi:hypothetical protein